MDNATDSISEWLGQLKSGEVEAAQNLWNRYSEELLRVAKWRLGASPRRTGDEEDVALSVFGSLFRGMAEGRLDNISSRDELWWVLLSITRRKAVDHIRRETAQKRHHQPNQPGGQHGLGPPYSSHFSLNDLVSSNPTPEFVAALEEQYQRLLALLRNDQLREIAALRLEGYNIAEIAQKVAASQRAVERKLHLIRTKWKRVLLDPDVER
jgi:RNA polymerase sigma factor (sigma-70 family)